MLFGIALLLLQSAAGISPVPPVPQLTVVVLEGEGGINNIHQRVGRDPVVQVKDENGKAVTGATVVFTLPAQGAGGSFATGGKIANVNTDAEGRAAAHGFRPNQVPGKFEIHVSASHQNRTARVTITQFNMSVPIARKGRGGKIAAVVLIVGAAAAAGAVAGTRGKSSGTSASTPPQVSTIVLSPVTGSVGPPR